VTEKIYQSLGKIYTGLHTCSVVSPRCNFKLWQYCLSYTSCVFWKMY